MSLAPMFIQGIGLLGPGLPSWPDSQATLRGTTPHQFVLTVLPAPPRLPPAERRRAGAVIRLAMAVAEEAIAHAGVDPQTLDPELHLNYLRANHEAPLRAILSNSFGFGGTNASLVLGAA